ncbi:amino acid permease [Clostridium chauvoei]|uniref:Amino acid permease n=2 Tax=Clostridium chauvoei TaxID=46867 RepID=S6EMR1_9CLOT|nr:amino acid permease [Clostridium chauvoei]ATD55754.1 amino acid permease [Clostridium chauvoei]ATD56570.1 amino acid permease [Clostridium chauvoei]MBX7280299.1 amino acid permease [Clostridium chauvoei]MBX7282784.1 amino acid permease [Clostridium chauvoei]MBX7285190.1 amino acid permease [Clostridium chauvoei]
MSNRRQTLSSGALMLMTFTAVFSFGNIIDSSVNVGLATIPSYIFGTIFYFFPFALMIGEFASANGDSESGITSWIKTSLGAKWAFLGSWAYFFVNLFFFTSLLPKTLIYGSYALVGRNVFDGKTVLISIISIILFWGVTIISTKGVTWVSKITSLSGIARILLGIGFIVFSFGIIIFLGESPAQEFTAQSMTPKFDWKYFMVLAWILQAVGGAESIGVYIKDVKGGNKAFIKTMLLSTIVVGLLYALGAAAVGIVVPESTLQGNFSNGLFDSFVLLGAHYGIGNIITNIVGFIMLLASLGSLVLWTAAPVKVLFSEIPEGIFGKWVAKTDNQGNPVNALYLQAVIVTILLIIPALGIGSVDSLLEILINMTASTSLIPVLFFLVGYIVLRLKKDNLVDRSFKVGSRKFGVAIGSLLLALFTFVFVISSVPSPAEISAYFNGTLEAGAVNPMFVLIYNVLGLVVFLGFALICWKRYEKRVGKDVANEVENLCTAQ